MALDDVQLGLAMVVGVVPAAIVGLRPRRRGRLVVVVLGVVTGVPMLIGGALAGVPVAAVAAIFLLGVAAAALASRTAFGQVVMVLALPMVGVGLSFPDTSKAAAVAGLMIAGSIGACLISMLWPERPQAARRAPPVTPSLGYGVRLGLAGASAAAIGFLLDLDHVGWACAAALLVMRPAPEMQRLRSVGRILAVIGGAVAAIVLIESEPAAAVYSIAAILVIAGAAATHRSRWYVTSAFTTFLVFALLLYAAPQDAGSRLGERVGETVLGVALAYLFGLVLPTWRDSRVARMRARYCAATKGGLG